MILKTFLKQPSERKDYDVTFAPWLSPMADTLDLVVTSVECLDDPLDTSLVVDAIAITSTLVKLWMVGGTPGLEYKVTINVTTVGGRDDESELIFVVEDI